LIETTSTQDDIYTEAHDIYFAVYCCLEWIYLVIFAD